MFVFRQTILDVGQGFAQGVAAFLALDFDFFAVDNERSNGRDDGGCTGQNRFRALFDCGFEFVHGKIAFADGDYWAGL